jgi:quercetin dioxygenase-like cupin family protein
MSDGDDQQDRLREHPRKRFSEPERLLDLDDAFDDLLSEDHGPVDGHRQIAIAHRRGMTLVLFYFEEGGQMPDHEVDGAVTIHLLDGDLEIHTDEREHHLQSGQMLILNPGVTHEVKAHRESKMLLTIGVEPESDETPPDESLAE